VADLTVIWWRDIPVQVMVRGAGRERARVQLPDRFQEAVDLAATRVGLIGSDDYMGQYRRDTRPCGDDLDTEAQAEAARLESAYGDDELMGLVRAGGVRPQGAPV
jgi:hypothetical protein